MQQCQLQGKFMDFSQQAEFLGKLKQQKVLILGLGREGLSSYHFFRQQFPDKELLLADQSELTQLDPAWQKIKKEDRRLRWYLGQDYALNLDCQLIVKTAGIPLSDLALQQAAQAGVEVSSNTALFFQFCDRQQIVGITGTKGKSTTSTLTYQILQAAGKNTLLVGNIGRPALDYLQQINAETLIVNELSSHQLATLKTSPHWAIVQDIMPEHLDYYRSFEEYFQAKTAIARYQSSEDIFIYNPELSGVGNMARLSQGQKFTHTLKSSQGDVYLEQDVIYYRDRANKQNEPVIKVEDIPLPGQHNLYNVMPAILLAKLLQVESAIIKKTIMAFRPLPHRLEQVAEVNGVQFIDDSIATNPFAAAAALRAFPQGKVLLLAGGHERNQDFRQLAQLIIEQRVKALFLFPTTGQRLEQFVQQAAKEHQLAAPPTFPVKNMQQAVTQAAQQAQAGDIVLLSPAAASFGLFKDYQDRGRQFAQAAQVLTSNKKTA